MARLPRIDLAGVPQHVWQRGNNRQPCFFDVADYTFFLDALRCAAHQHDCAVYAYVLMTHHVHLLVSGTQVGDMLAMMQTLGRRDVRGINQRYAAVREPCGKAGLSRVTSVMPWAWAMTGWSIMSATWP